MPYIDPCHLPAPLPQFLSYMRAREDMTQREVAAHIRVHQSLLARWETGRRIPSARQLVALMHCYRMSPEEQEHARRLHFEANIAA